MELVATIKAPTFNFCVKNMFFDYTELQASTLVKRSSLEPHLKLYFLIAAFSRNYYASVKPLALVIGRCKQSCVCHSVFFHTQNIK